MSLSNVMRRAASLLVEMPPEPIDRNISSADVPELDDIDLELPPEARVSSLTAGTPHAKSIDQIVREAQGPNLDEVKVDDHAAGAVIKGEGGAVDFAAVYRAAKLPDTAFGAEQMLETLASLPLELPLETRRLTVKAMLGTLGKTTGATPDSIVADASRKLAALESFAAFIEKRTSDTIGKAQTEIADLEHQIEVRKQSILTAKNEMARVVATCEGESERLDDVLEFFSLDVGASRHAPAPLGSAPHASPQGAAAPNPAHFHVASPAERK